MITEQRVMALFEEANPVPDADKLGVVVAGATDYLATLNQRSAEMTKIAIEKKDQTRNQTMLRWSVAAAVIILAGIGFVLVNQTDGSPVAAGPGPASGESSEPVSVVVPGTEWWTDTGIDLSIDDMVSIEAEGAVTPSTDNEPHVGPDGVPDRPSAQVYNVEGLEEENHASLIGRIGESGAPFLVGSELSFTADTEGRLFLGINDDSVKNNAGAFTATITVNSS